MAKLSLYLAALMFGNSFGAPSAPARPAAEISAPAPAGPSARSPESQMVQLLNAARRIYGLNALATNPVLARVAREHSQEMCEKRYFSHSSPTSGLTTPMDRYKSAIGWQPTWAYLGENLFYCSVVDPRLGHQCLMASPKHRDNILNPRYEQVGVGVYVAPDGRFWVTELFLAQID